MMNKNEFLKKLKIDLKQAHVSDSKRYLQDYDELISDESEAKAISEDEVIQSLGDPSKIVQNIITEDHPKMRTLTTGTIALIVIALVLGSPLWCSLLLIALVLLALGYFLIWLIPAGLTLGTFLALVLGSYGLPAAFIAMFKVNIAIGFSELGFSVAALGIALLLAKLTWWSIKYFSLVSVTFYNWGISKFRRENNVNTPMD